MTNLFDLGLRRCVVAALWWLSILADASAAEPERAKGLSVHMLPDRVAQIDGRSGGFIVRDSGGESSYPDGRALIVFFQTLSGSTRENGIWVVITNPSAYSATEAQDAGHTLRRKENSGVHLSRFRATEWVETLRASDRLELNGADPLKC